MNGKHVMWFDLILDSLYYHTASVLNYIDAIVIAFIYEKKLRLAYFIRSTIKCSSNAILKQTKNKTINASVNECTTIR